MKFWALSYSIPANPSRYRVAVWKALKELGAVYLQPAVAVVPQREGVREALLAIRERVLASGGTAALLSIAAVETRLSPETVKPPASRPARPASQVRPMPKTPPVPRSAKPAQPQVEEETPQPDSRRADMPVFLF